VSLAFGGMLWSLSLAYLLGIFQLMEPATTGLVVVYLVAALGAVIVGLPQLWDDRYRNPVRSGLTAAALATFGVVIVNLIASNSIQAIDGGLRKKWVEQRDLFVRDVHGFPELQRIGRDVYGLELELGDVEDSYWSTTRAAPGASVGLMTIYPGYCQMGLWPTGIAREYAPLPGDRALPASQVLFAVAVHELGHCVDLARDQSSFRDGHVGTASFSPRDRIAVTDVHSYNAVERRPATKLWREVYADLFSVGYAKLVWPADAAVFERLLIAKRSSNAKFDPVHASSCWLRAAVAVAAPRDLASLPAWADDLRSTTPCALPGVGASSASASQR